MPTPDSTPTALTAAIALAHERLYPRVTALLKQVERSAGRQPKQPVPDATRAVAQSLFAEARKLLGREVGSIANHAFRDLAALGVALGQLVAALESFEAAHSGFSARAKCILWRVAGQELPVARLKPPGVEAGPRAEATPEQDRARTQLFKLIASRFAAGYDEGYRDASEGRPPSSRYAEGVWDTLVRKRFGNDETARLTELKRRYGTTTPPPHLMPIGAKIGEWARIERERFAADQAERLRKYGGPSATE